MTFRSICLIGAAPACCALLVSSSLAHGGRSADPPGFVRVRPDQVRWIADPADHGAQFATVLGDPDKPGVYVIRGKFPPHLMDAPHWHSQDRYVTVLQGVWYAGTGPVFDPARAIPMGPGSLMKHPAGGVHWDGSAGDGTAIVQIVGVGPVDTVQLDPKGPEWITVTRRH